VIIGHSLGGRPIEAVVIGSVAGGVLIFGAIHGDEPASAELCHRYLGRGLPTGVKGMIVPVANPDGLAAGTKDNGRGVDLNRNFAARSWRREHPPGYDPGSGPESEPEARALAQVIEAHRPRVIVAVHQPLACVNWDGPAAALADAMSAACGLPAKASVGYPTPGSFGARYGVDLELPVITLELPRTVADRDYDACLRALDCATMWQGPWRPR
jgi:protein MpaA